jgi:hypothetical protein
MYSDPCFRNAHAALRVEAVAEDIVRLECADVGAFPDDAVKQSAKGDGGNCVPSIASVPFPFLKLYPFMGVRETGCIPSEPFTVSGAISIGKQ